MNATQMTCAECGDGYDYTEAEQKFRAEHGMAPPQRCPDCRAARRAVRNADLATAGPSTMFGAPEPVQRRNTPRSGGARPGRAHNPSDRFPAVCAACGAATYVPFVPRGDRPVYCRACFNARRGR